MANCVDMIPTVNPPAPPQLRTARTLAWIAILLIAAAGISWGGAQLARVRAPWLLYPLLIGGATGAAAGGLALALEWKHRPTLPLGAILAAIVVVVGMHWQAYRAEVSAPRSGELAMISQAFPDVAERHGAAPPTGFLAFLERMARQGRPLPFGYTATGVWTWLTWTLDAALTIGASVVMARLLTNRPYCDQCGTYYRVLRRESLTGTRLKRLGMAFSRQFSPEWRSEFRYLACRCDGGVDRLELRILERLNPLQIIMAWISATDRARLFQQLDQVG